MIVDLLDKLLDRLLELFRERERLNQDLFEQLIRPAFINFEAIHQDYVTSFQGYQEALAKSPVLGPDHSVFSDIVRDSLARQTLRNRLVALQAPYAVSSDLVAFVEAIRAYLSLGADCFLDEDSVTQVVSPSELERTEMREFSPRFLSWLSIQRKTHIEAATRKREVEVMTIYSSYEQDTNVHAVRIAEVMYREVSKGDSQLKPRQSEREVQSIIAAIDGIIRDLQASHLRVVTEFEKLRCSLLSPTQWRPTQGLKRTPGGAA